MRDEEPITKWLRRCKCRSCHRAKMPLQHLFSYVADFFSIVPCLPVQAVFMPEVFDWRRAAPRDVLVRAVQRLAAGQLVIFPTETSYVACACALNPAAVRRLVEIPPAGTSAP